MTSIFAGKKFLAIIFLSCLLLFSSSTTTNAREVGILLTPILIDIHPQQNGIIEKALIVENIGDDSINLSISKKAFLPGEDGNIFYPADENVPEAAKTFLDENVEVLENDIAITSLSLAPGQKQQLDLKVIIKDYQSISDYTFSLFFISNNQPEVVGEQEESAIHSQLQAKVGSAIHVLVQGKTNEPTRPMNITSFKTKNFTQQGPIYFNATLKNNSHKYINLYGKIIITNMFGQKVGIVRIPSQIILAGAEKSFGSDSNGINKDIFPLEWNEKFLLGKYNAHITFTTAGGQEAVAETSFLAFPLRTTLLVLLGLLIASFLISQVRERVR